jgi:hypothetical protein
MASPLKREDERNPYAAAVGAHCSHGGHALVAKQLGHCRLEFVDPAGNSGCLLAAPSVSSDTPERTFTIAPRIGTLERR